VALQVERERVTRLQDDLDRLQDDKKHLHTQLDALEEDNNHLRRQLLTANGSLGWQEVPGEEGERRKETERLQEELDVAQRRMMSAEAELAGLLHVQKVS
jgi:hypothetical protein